MLGQDITQKLLLRSVLVKWCRKIGDSLMWPRADGEDLEDKTAVDGFGSADVRKSKSKISM